MVTWVIYDISKDKARTKVAKLCLQAGLYRVQESVFLGELCSNRRDELYAQFLALLSPETDRVYLAPVSREDLDKTLIIGEGFDFSLVKDEKTQLLF